VKGTFFHLATVPYMHVKGTGYLQIGKSSVFF
jgi:hypothetical protein